MSIKRFLFVFFGTLFIGGCGGDGSEDEALDSASTSMPMSAPAAAPEPATIADLFPEGEGRIMVLNNCSSCHAVACSVIGQRTEARWDAIRSAHMDRLPGLSTPQMDTLFGYLAANFNDSQPEPNVPRAFLVTGCTPQ